MGIKYDLIKLQKIINDYTRITKVSVWVLDVGFNKIASTYDISENEFCLEIRSNKYLDNKCSCSDKILLERCRDSKSIVIHRCHAGLTDFAIPLTKNKEIIGYLLLGGIRQNENISFEGYDTISRDVKEKIFAKFKNIVYYNDVELQSIINLAVMITTSIMSENIIEKDCDSIIDEACTYIENNLDKDLSVKSICKELSVSKNILYDHFKYIAKSTIGEYINERRIFKACKLLTDTEKPISEIANECGISNYTYFIKFFKSHMGVTPYKYRTENSSKKI